MAENSDKDNAVKELLVHQDNICCCSVSNMLLAVSIVYGKMDGYFEYIDL